MQKTNDYKASIAALCAVFLVSLAACNSLNDTVDCRSNEFYGYPIAMPPGASSVQESCSNGINPTYRASYTMPTSDLATLQQTTYVSSITDWQTSVPSGSSLSDEASQATSLLYGSYINGAISLDVLIDTSNAEQYQVYVVSSNID